MDAETRLLIERDVLTPLIRFVQRSRVKPTDRQIEHALVLIERLREALLQSVRSVTPQEKIGVAHLHSMFNIVIRKHYGAEVPSCSGEACRACEDVAREFPHLKEIIEDPPKTVTPQEQSVEAIIAAFNEGFALGTLKRLDQAWEGSQTKRNLETTSRREGPLRYRLPEGNPPLPIPTPPASSEQP